MKNIENLLSVLSLVVKLDPKVLNLAAEPKKYWVLLGSRTQC